MQRNSRALNTYKNCNRKFFSIYETSRYTIDSSRNDIHQMGLQQFQMTSHFIYKVYRSRSYSNTSNRARRDLSEAHILNAHGRETNCTSMIFKLNQVV